MIERNTYLDFDNVSSLHFKLYRISRRSGNGAKKIELLRFSFIPFCFGARNGEKKIFLVGFN